jgi:hypothetical protein
MLQSELWLEKEAEQSSPSSGHQKQSKGKCEREEQKEEKSALSRRSTLSSVQAQGNSSYAGNYESP